MAATMIGNLPEYRHENELFSSYIERVEFFFEANSIADEKNVTVVLSLVGSKTYSLLRSLVAPAKSNEKSYKDLVAVLMKHFKPTPIIIAERFHFHRRAQAVAGSISEYMAELRKLTTHCHLWYVKAWRARVRKYTEIVEDYGGVANGCQLSLLAKEWSVGQKTSR